MASNAASLRSASRRAELDRPMPHCHVQLCQSELAMLALALVIGAPCTDLLEHSHYKSSVVIEDMNDTSNTHAQAIYGDASGQNFFSAS